MRALAVAILLLAWTGPVAAKPVPLLRIEAGGDVLEAGAAQILNVQVQKLDLESPAVVVTLDPNLRQKLTALTTAHVGEALVIFVCGQEVSRPLLYEPVTKGAFAIQEDDLPHLTHLAAVLRAKDCQSAPSS